MAPSGPYPRTAGLAATWSGRRASHGGGLTWVAVRGRLVPLLVTLAGAALVGLLVYGVSTQAASRTLDEALRRGEHPLAPDAAQPLPRLEAAGSGSLAQLRGEVVVLNFWASWCEPCQVEAPLLERAQTALLAHGGTVLGVTYKDLSSDSAAFAHQYHLTFPNLRDKEGSFAATYGTDRIPESFIINRQGRIVAISRGEIEQGFLDRAIALARST
jgi:cytochrome c biogenesis protein CcmG, thiol:disulfide interchange protein DsbE